MPKIINQTIFGYPCRGTRKQLDEMYDLLNREDYTNQKFNKYFYAWISGNNTGVWWFPKDKYCSLNGNHYAIALRQVGGLVKDEDISDYDPNPAYEKEEE